MVIVDNPIRDSIDMDNFEYQTFFGPPDYVDRMVMLEEIRYSKHTLRRMGLQLAPVMLTHSGCNARLRDLSQNLLKLRNNCTPFCHEDVEDSVDLDVRIGIALAEAWKQSKRFQ